jgi:uncharacterized membrane protein
MDAERRGKETGAGRSAGRSMQAGMLLAAAAGVKSFERTLMPRTTRDQGAVTGLSVATTYATTALFQDVIESVAAYVVKRDGEPDHDKLRRATMLADLLAIGVGMVTKHQLAQQPNESMGRAAMRTWGDLMSFAGLAGFTAGFSQDVLDVLDPNEARRGSNRTFGVAVVGGGLMALIAEYRRRSNERRVLPEEASQFKVDQLKVQAFRSLLVSGGITACFAAIGMSERALGTLIGRALGQGLAGGERFWRLAGHGASLAVLGGLAYAGLDRVYQDIEAGTAKIEPAFDKPPELPTVSGSAQSRVAWRTMGREGRRHVLTALSRETIGRVMGKPAVADPIRVFVGLESAQTELDRINLAVEELKRTGAFDRELLIAISPTGTGYVNYVTMECCEYFTLGNCAAVTLQYSKRPSPLSMDRVWEGRKQFRMLLAALRRELYKRDPSERPRLVIFGESLGAHTSQDAFLNEGTQGLEDAAVDRALWIGSPHLSKWKVQVLGNHRPDVDRSLLIDVDSFSDLDQLSPEAREKLRYVMITHHNDGVGLFGADLVVQKPAWLGEPELRPPSVPKWMRWVPIITAVQTAVDMKNAMNVVPGEFVANGHDYRADLARFVREVYSLPCSDQQLASVEAALREDEILRQQKFDLSLEQANAEKVAPHPAEDGASLVEDRRAAA